MLCYVGKATKIFVVAMAVLIVASLVLAFALIIRRAPRHRLTQDGTGGATYPVNCDQGNSDNVACSPVELPGPGVPAPRLLNPQPPPAAPGPDFPSERPNFQ